MMYLMRAARRVSAAGAAAAGAVRLRPAMPSRSPLAEADQRLNIDSFAEHFDVPMVREGSDAAGENEPVAPTASDRSGSLASERSLAPKGEPRIAPSESAISAVRTASGSESAPARAKPTRIPAPPVAARLTKPQTQTSASDSGAADLEKPLPLPDRRSVGRPSLQVNSPHDPGDVAGSRQAHGSLRMEPAHPAAQGPAPERGRATDPMVDALSRAMRWVEGRSRNSREEERGERRKESPQQGPQARLGEIVEARPLRPALRDVRPITHLEIGKIEVEVVRPVKAAVAPRPSPKAAGSRNTSRRAFGWRQR